MNEAINKTKINWNTLGPELQNAVLNTLTYTIQHSTVQTYGRAKQVCKLWYRAFTDKDNIILNDLVEYQVLFTQIFKRLIIGLCEIDLGPSPKYSYNIYHNTHGIGDPGTDTDQKFYERCMIIEAANNAMGYYNNHTAYKRIPKNERQALVQNADIMRQYYELPAIPYRDTIGLPDHCPPYPEECSGYSTMTIGELFEKIQYVKNTFTVNFALKRIQSLAIQYNLLPIDAKNPALGIVNLEANLWKQNVKYMTAIIIAIIFGFSFLYQPLPTEL